MNQDQLLDDGFFEPSYEYEGEILRPGNFVILFVASFGLYGVWWMYKQWRFFKEKEGSDIYPVARAIFAIFFLHSLFEKILSFARSQGYTRDYSSTGLFVFFIALNFLSRLPSPWDMVTLLGFFAFLQPIRALNFALIGPQEFEGVDLSEFNWRQWCVIVIGGVLLLSSFAAGFLGLA